MSTRCRGQGQVPQERATLQSSTIRRAVQSQSEGKNVMDPAIEILESYGLVADQDSLRILEFGKKQVLQLHNKLSLLSGENCMMLA
jgi:hypothetical protein